MESTNESREGPSRTPRSRSRSRGRGKSYRNPYLNFLRDFRRESSSSMDPKEVMIRGGKVWKCMLAEEKQVYVDEASQVARDVRPTKRNKSKGKRATQGERKKAKNSKTKPKRRNYEESDDASTSSYESD